MARMVMCAAALYAASLPFLTPHEPAGWPVMQTGGMAEAPRAAQRFCLRSPKECEPSPRYLLAPARMGELMKVNIAVNEEIDPISDFQQYGKADVWSLPKSQGDCEDYALLKRHRLMALGWPASALLIAVVRKGFWGQGHAVLVAAIPQGDFVLDNMTDEVLPWHATGYSFVMRQSTLDPRLWVWVRS